MFAIYEWIINNYQLLLPIGILLVILSLTGNITQTVRTAKIGLKEAITPLGFVIMLAITFIVYQIYLSIMETL